MATYRFTSDDTGYDTETIKLVLLSILSEHGPMTLDTERFRNMGSHGAWSLYIGPAEENGRMQVSVNWK